MSHESWSIAASRFLPNRSYPYGIFHVFHAAIIAISLLVWSNSLFAQNLSPASQKELTTVPDLAREFLALPLSAMPSLPGNQNTFSVMPPLVDLAVAKGAPLRVILKQAVPVKRVGQPIQAYTTDPIYAFDRIVVPQGSEVDGRIVRIVPPSALKKTSFYLSADFSPHRTVQVQFDTLILPNGRRVPLQTEVMPDVGPVMKLETNPQKNGAVHRARGFISQQWHGAIAQLKPSALWQHAKAFVSSELPYHKQKLSAGTVFVAELEQSLDFGPAIAPASEFGAMGRLPVTNSQAFARLTTPLNSATSRVGALVDAVLTRPVFSADNKLLLPVGTELQGTVVRARPARRLHRNGQLHFKLNRIQLPSSASRSVEMALEGLEVSKASHIRIDSEGGTSVASNGESRVLTTMLSAAIATTTLDTDSGHAGATASSENRPLGGLSGYKLVGLAISLGARSPTLSQTLGFLGTGQSVYLHFIARGQDLILPKDTPIEISFGEQRSHPGEHSSD